MQAKLIVSLVLGAGLVAACSSSPRQVSATAPTVSYQVSGSDVSQANVSAARYCEQYGMTAQLQQVVSSTATYNCIRGTVTSSNAPSSYYAAPAVAPAPVVVPAPAVECADTLHQGRPGGSDYVGPPVPGCPPR
jgi:hypothetical protein